MRSKTYPGHVNSTQLDQARLPAYFPREATSNGHGQQSRCAILCREGK